MRGKPRPLHQKTERRKDHPRGCGENPDYTQAIQPCMGSPPRMRGKLTRQRVVAEAFRITPADAGKTWGLISKKMPSKDHPRGCGENVNTMEQQNKMVGSPPRMRGKLIFVRTVPLRPGITPADAGKTRIFRAAQRRNKDHPRGCGENEETGEITDIVAGSPPRMRGKLRRLSGSCGSGRITPADAGKTGQWSESGNL